MGYFVAYRSTGADPARLKVLLPAVRDALVQRGEDVYCTYFDEDRVRSFDGKTRQIMGHAFSEIDASNGLFVVLDGNEKSEGMLIELGYCLARKIRIVVAQHSSVTGSSVKNLADYAFEYDDVDDLKQKILTTEDI